MTAFPTVKTAANGRSLKAQPGAAARLGEERIFLATAA
jgi:hypothetical protein